MNWVDSIILIVMLLSAITSVLEGLVKEVLSLSAWLVSLIVTLLFMDKLAHFLITFISLSHFRLTVAFIMLFLMVFLIMTGINLLIIASLPPMPTFLSISEKILGMLFGYMRSVIAILLLVLLAGLTRLPTMLWWQESLLLQQYFQPVAILLCKQLSSAETAQQFHFQPVPPTVPKPNTLSL